MINLLFGRNWAQSDFNVITAFESFSGWPSNDKNVLMRSQIFQFHAKYCPISSVEAKKKFFYTYVINCVKFIQNSIAAKTQRAIKKKLLIGVAETVIIQNPSVIISSLKSHYATSNAITIRNFIRSNLFFSYFLCIEEKKVLIKNLHTALN